MSLESAFTDWVEGDLTELGNTLRQEGDFRQR